MGLARPTGEYAEQMLAPDGWPEADEDANYDRAQQYIHVLRQAAEVSDHCHRGQLDIFDGGVWTGGAASAADRQLGKSVDALMTLLDGLATVITWHRHIAGSILQAKFDITDNVEGAHEQIRAVEKNVKLTADQRASAIAAVVTATRGTNSDVVVMTAARILGTKAWKPPDSALQDLLDQKLPPLDESSPVPTTPGDEGPSGTDPAQPGPRVPPLSGPKTPPLSGPAVPPPAAPGAPTGVLPLNPGVPAWTPVSPVGVPSPEGPGTGPKTPATPRNSAASTPPEDSRDGDAGPSAQALSDGHSPGGGSQDDSPRVAPASATGMPAMPVAPAAGGGGSAGAAPVSGGGTESGMGGPGGRTPPAKAAGVRPASVNGRANARREPAARRESSDRSESVEGAAAAVIPVSSARAERDAIAEAARSDAARRRGADPMQLARRIAAALNAPVDDKEPDLGFFWVTGVTTDGAIVVANSYGLAYIPEGVQLPEQVHMATADKAISAGERASWVTYPALAVQGWAAHHNVKLRALIATAEQLADSNPDVAKILLQVDDIPNSGEMIGRSRLEVADPGAAERLAQTPDAHLLGVLPPPPADADPPADQRFRLWLSIVKIMAHDDPRRQTPHLQAFHAYVANAQELAGNDAYTAADPVAQRRAVSDWFYWKHLAELLHAAQSAESEVPAEKGAPIGG
jgi:hypothetical protein